MAPDSFSSSYVYLDVRAVADDLSLQFLPANWIEIELIGDRIVIGQIHVRIADLDM